MNIAAYKPFSLSDYPGKLAAIVFTGGCNFRCPYCHNRSLIRLNRSTSIPIEEVFTFLKRRRGKLQALVITGGEPTLQEGLIPFMEEVKALGYLVKLDTNGSLPGVLETVIHKGLVDYIAMDIKGPLEKYSDIVRRPVDEVDIMESIRLIMGSGINYEFRTTVVKSLLSPVDLESCARLIRGAKQYILQRFIPSEPLEESFKGEKSYSDEEFSGIIEKLLPFVEKCLVR